MNKQFGISLVTLAISNIKQIIPKMKQFKEEQLSKLDQMRQQSKPKKQKQVDQMQEQLRFQISEVEKENDIMMKQLQIIRHRYDEQTSNIKNQNMKYLKNESEEIIPNNPYQELVKELIDELANFRNIGVYWNRLDTLKREQHITKQGGHNAQTFMDRIGEIIGDENSKEGEIIGDQILDISEMNWKNQGRWA